MTGTTAFHEAVFSLLRDVSQNIILPHYQSLTSDQIDEKSPDDLVTVADRLAEERLAEGLARIIPGVPIVGEEAAHADPSVLDRLSGQDGLGKPAASLDIIFDMDRSARRIAGEVIGETDRT